MKGDSIIVEPHHEKGRCGHRSHHPAQTGEYGSAVHDFRLRASQGAANRKLQRPSNRPLELHGISSVIFQQDDYFVYPPKTN